MLFCVFVIQLVPIIDAAVQASIKTECLMLIIMFRFMRINGQITFGGPFGKLYDAFWVSPKQSYKNTACREPKRLRN